MSHPQYDLRIYLDGGPRSGETVSVAPDDEGAPPQRIEIGDTGVLDPTAEETGLVDRTAPTTSAYELSHTDMHNGLWVYRPAGPG